MMGFWEGFFKRADAAIGGGGFTGAGKGNLPTGYSEQGSVQGTASSEDTKPDNSMRDTQRDSQNHSIMFREPTEGPADSNPHIFY